MVWQQWVLLIWMIIRIPFMIGRELSKPRIDKDKEMEPGDREKAIAIGVAAIFVVQATLIALVVTI